MDTDIDSPNPVFNNASNYYQKRELLKETFESRILTGHAFIIEQDQHPIAMAAGYIDGNKITLTNVLIGPNKEGSRSWIYTSELYFAGKSYYDSIGISVIDYQLEAGSSMDQHANKKFFDDNKSKLGIKDIQITDNSTVEAILDSEVIDAVQVTVDKTMNNIIGATFIQLGSGSLLETPVTITLDICVPKPNTTVTLILENSNDQTISPIKIAVNDTVIGWQTLSFPIDSAQESIYNKASILFDRTDTNKYTPYFFTEFTHPLLTISPADYKLYAIGSNVKLIQMSKEIRKNSYESRTVTWTI